MHFISNPNSLFIRQISFIPHKMSLKFFFLHQILFHTVFGLVQEFDSFDRKVFKNKKQKYATFDEKGIMTLDGTVNGKTNDIGYPNLDSDYNRDTCQKDQKLFFEICETQKLGAWIGLAICYESSLSQPNINPFFRTQIENKKRRRLIKVMCGERQNAIFIRREAPFVDEKSGQYIVPEKNDERFKASKKYQSFYSFSTSFSPNKLYFRMPNDTAEKRCVIFHFGGENLGKMNLTNLRREPIEEVYKEVQITEKRRILQKIVPENDTEFYNHKFTDMANRKYRLSKDQGLWLLMLDFVPAFLRVQNISMYGWLPVRIKITGQSIKPCTLDWIFLQSREVSGGLTASSLRLAYTVETGTTTSKNEDSGKSSNNGTNNEETKSKNNEDKSTLGVPGLASIGLSFKNSVSNTKGWNEDAGSVDRETESFTQYKSKVRVEQVEFPSLQGTINIEQQVLICHGVQFNIDRIRYRDPDGEDLVPSNIEVVGADADVDDNTPEGNAEQLPSIKNAKCADRQPQCTVWASKGECKKTPAFMLTQCKESCKVCSIVSVERKEKDPYANKEEEETLPCADQDEYCVAWKEAGECNKDPHLMSNICRKSCGLCIPREDFKKMKKEWRLNEGLDDYDYLYDQNNQ